MPRKLYKRRAKPKKPIYKKRKPRSVSTIIKNPAIGGFPKIIYTTLKYHTSFTLDPSTGGTNGVRVFKLNGIYDPDVAVGGKQPRGFYQWMLHYNHWYISSSRISATFSTQDTSYSNTIGIAFRDDASVEANPLDYVEQDCSYRLQGSQNSKNGLTTLSRNYKFKNQQGTNYKSSENKGSLVSDPLEIGYAHIFCGNEFGNDSLGTNTVITIHYNVMFCEQKDIIESS